MKKFLSKKLKSEKGFTLVELLAVIVILAILAAIAIPVIANLIGNSKEDAHDATAQQMIEAARLAQASGDGGDTFTLQQLVDGEYLSKPTNPETNKDYNMEGSTVTLTGGQWKAEVKEGQEVVGEAGSDAAETETND